MAERLIQLEASSSRTAFIDVEASSLSAASWPVEIGWAFERGDPHSALVRPHETWPDAGWSAEAQRLHGIRREDLAREGRSPREVAEELNTALSGFDVWSDAPDWDGFWLFRLFGVAGIKQRFPVGDFGKLMKPLAGAREVEALRRAARISPRRHRAGPDAKHLQTIYAIARGVRLAAR